MLVKIGRDATGRELTIPLPARSWIITGKTRSGKSICLYNLLKQVRNWPVRVAGIDPSGIVFNAMPSDPWRVKTLRDIPRAVKVMREIVEEMDARLDLLLSRKLDKFTEFSDDFPLLLVVFEEYPAMLALCAAYDKANGLRGKDATETTMRYLIKRLVLEGLKCGCVEIVLSQRGDADIVDSIARASLCCRVSFSQDSAGFRMLHEGISPEQVERAFSFEPGMAYIEVAGRYPLLEMRGYFSTYQDLLDAFETPPHR